MMPTPTFLWHDYETWGSDPRRDRPVQFAALRTDLDFNPVDAPLVLYARPAGDFLPSPEACLVTGITPQQALARGVREAELIGEIHRQMARPGTCSLGYNSIRFDDEVTRFTLYRNFYDPYAREWQNGNSRWDLIDVVRLTRALRPEGIQWPDHETGQPSFRLEDLTRVNGIGHELAHDALSDVRATLALARLLRDRQPRLYDYAYRMRAKHKVAGMLSPERQQPVLHASARYPARYCGTALVAPIARHPENQNGILVYDLRYDPEPWLGASAEDLHRLLYSPRDELGNGEERLPVKTVRINHCPVLAPLGTLTEEAAARLEIDVAAGMRHLDRIRERADFGQRVCQALALGERMAAEDPDRALYSGGFFGDADRRRMEWVRRATPEELAGAEPGFEDPRLAQLLFRYRARNWPESLSPEEARDWKAFCRARIRDPLCGGEPPEAYLGRLRTLSADPAQSPAGAAVLAELRVYAQTLWADIGG